MIDNGPAWPANHLLFLVEEYGSAQREASLMVQQDSDGKKSSHAGPNHALQKNVLSCYNQHPLPRMMAANNDIRAGLD